MRYILLMNVSEILDLLAVAEGDRAVCAGLLEALENPAVIAVEAELARRLGSFSVAPPEVGCTDSMTWLTAFLRRTPTVARWYDAHGVPASVIAATFADVGRNLRIHRRAHGEFGLETWDWLIPHYTGMMFALGRLNFMLHPAPVTIEGVLTAGQWYLGIHVPESGPLSPATVDESVDSAAKFFPEFFPDRPVDIAVCESWLLDPVLVEVMGAGTNVGAFGQRFTKLRAPYDDASAALFFVFRTRELGDVPSLPRRTSLQRLVLDRAERGEAWQIGTGYLRLVPGHGGIAG
jgi:hypothetical protein